MTGRRIHLAALGLGCLGLVPCQARIGTDTLWQATSDSVVPFVVLSELTLYGDGAEGRHEAWQGLQALAATAAVTEGLKSLVDARRPDGSDLDSFPSLHAATAFTMATVIQQYRPKYAPLAYTAAGLISLSRIELDKHHWQDVIAGAALGYLSGRIFTHHRVAITPEGVAFRAEF